jgi:hypothetical protein
VLTIPWWEHCIELGQGQPSAPTNQHTQRQRVNMNSSHPLITPQGMLPLLPRAVKLSD